MYRALLIAATVGSLIAGVYSWIGRMRPEPLPPDAARLETATFAGGCYWCMEPAFDRLPGVVHVRAGYAGEADRRREAVEVRFDPQRTTYAVLLDQFWRNVDPLDDRGQFCDSGIEYTSAIYPRGEGQLRLAEASRQAMEVRLEKQVSTSVVVSGAFEPAAEYDQNYYRKHPVRYAFYRLNCGRDARLSEVWGAR